MTTPERTVRVARRVVLALTLGALVYAVSRFEVLQLPPGARSPLFGVAAGDRILVDQRAREPRVGEAWLFRAPGGALLLGRCSAPPADLPEAQRAELARGAAWLLFEREIPDLADSSALGAIAPEALAGRVVFVLPW